MDDNVVRQVKRYPGNRYKSFRSLAEAQEWIGTPGPSPPNPPIGVEGSTSLLALIPPPSPDNTPIPTVSEPSASSEPSSSQADKPQMTWQSAVSLSLEQTLVLGMVKAGGNVFFTGSAGRFHENSGCIQCLMSQERGSLCC